jgi:hypothetical protein
MFDLLSDNIPHSYAKDKNDVYFGHEIIQGADPDSFEVIDLAEWLAKDKNYVYDYLYKLD